MWDEAKCINIRHEIMYIRSMYKLMHEKRRIVYNAEFDTLLLKAGYEYNTNSNLSIVLNPPEECISKEKLLSRVVRIRNYIMLNGLGDTNAPEYLEEAASIIRNSKSPKPYNAHISPIGCNNRPTRE